MEIYIYWDNIFYFTARTNKRSMYHIEIVGGELNYNLPSYFCCAVNAIFLINEVHHM